MIGNKAIYRFLDTDDICMYVRRNLIAHDQHINMIHRINVNGKKCRNILEKPVCPLKQAMARDYF